jgi:outer membrane protein assembly factor BamB
MLGSSEWPKSGTRVAVGEAGDSFVELISSWSLQTAFAGIARVTLDGKTQWIEKGVCDPGGNDFPAPHDFVRRDDHLLLVCNTKDSGVEVLEVDGSDAEVSNDFVDGELSGGVVIAGEGVLAFFVTFDGESGSLVTFTRDHGSELDGPTLARASIAAVAKDGTLVVNTNDGVAAISDRSLRWQQQVTSPRATFVDSDHTIITATNGTVVALDLASGSKIWEVALPTNDNVLSLASGGPGKIYALSETTLTLVSD